MSWTYARKEYEKEWREKNKEARKAYMKQWRRNRKILGSASVDTTHSKPIEETGKTL